MSNGGSGAGRVRRAPVHSRWLRSVTVAGLAVALLGVGPAGHASTSRSTRIALAVTPSTSLVRGPLVLVGKAVPALPKVALTVAGLEGGRWHTLGHVRESASGSFSLTVKAPTTPGPLRLRVTRGAASHVAAGVSPTLAVHVVRAAFSVKAHPTSAVVQGTPVTVTGVVTPTARGSVALQRELHGRWVTLVTSRLVASRFTLAAAEPTGAYDLRVLSPLTAVRAAGVSPVFTVVVRTPAAPQPIPPTTPPPAAPTQPTVPPTSPAPIPNATLPGAPAVAVTFGPTTATVTWTPPADGGAPITAYRASRDGTDTNGFGAFTATVAANVLSWTFDQIKSGEPYTFSVVAVNQVGRGPAGSLTAGGTGTSSWAVAGHDLGNTRNNPDEHVIGDANVSTLVKKWSATFTGNTTGTPSVVDGAVYLPDTKGNLWDFDAATGKVRWTTAVGSYTGLAGDSTRNTAVADGRVVFGDKQGGGHVSRMVAVNAGTGALLWSTVVDSQPSSQITGAPTIDGNVAYMGVSSSEDGKGACCSFRGSVVAVDVTTGALLWKTYTVPTGYAGGSVWSSAPVVDEATGLVYVGTGNGHAVPPGVCLAPTSVGCTQPADDNDVDSLLALDIATGTPAWALRTLATDVNSPACTDITVCGPDYDFGSDPNLFTTTIAGEPRTLLGIGQKSGVYWAVDAATGALVWKTQVGPGGGAGGIQWGSATDGLRIYVASVNSAAVPWALQPAGTVTTTGGFFSALDPATGAILWQTADPQGAEDFGYVSTANGVVYFGSGAGTGASMYALEARHGAITWSYAPGGSTMGGAAIVDGRVYWASGYYTNNCPPASTTCGKTYALTSFGLPGQ